MSKTPTHNSQLNFRHFRHFLFLSDFWMRPRPLRPEPEEGSRRLRDEAGRDAHLDQNYLNFNVLMARSARAMAMIQNRTMTLGSGQPFNSK